MLYEVITIAKPQIAAMQTKIVENFPNVSVIDTTELLTIFTAMVRKLSLIIRFFAAFSIVAGMLIILVITSYSIHYTKLYDQQLCGQ